MRSIIQQRKDDSMENAQINCDIMRVHKNRVEIFRHSYFDEWTKAYSEQNDFFEDALIQKEMNLKKRELLEPMISWYQSQKQIVTQDGIKIPLKVCDLLPLGATTGNVNLMADARLALNVSRNAIDESPKKLFQWKEKIGKQILSKMNDLLKGIALEYNIDFKRDDVWLSDSNDFIIKKEDWLKME